MGRYVYPLKCDACEELDLFEFNLLKETNEFWELIRPKIEKKEFLCKTCSEQIK